MVAQVALTIGRTSGVRGAGWVAKEHRRLFERGFVGVHDFRLHRSGREPFRMRMTVPLAPGAEQAGRDEADARVTVVTRAECGDEVLERLPQAWILVVGCVVESGRERLRVCIIPGAHFHAGLHQILRHAARLARVFHVNAKHTLAAARGNTVEQTLHRHPVKRGRSGHHRGKRQITKLQRMRKIPAFASVRNEALEGVVRRAGCIGWLENNWLRRRHNSDGQEGGGQQGGGAGEGGECGGGFLHPRTIWKTSRADRRGRRRRRLVARFSR